VSRFQQPLLGTLAPFPRILFSILLMISGFGAFFLLGLLLAVPLYGISFSDLQSLMLEPETPETLRILQYFQVLQSFGLFIFPAWLAAWLIGGNASKWLKINRLLSVKFYLLTLVVMVCSIPFINMLITWNEAMSLPAVLEPVETWMKNAEEEATRLTDAFLSMSTWGGFLFNLFMIAILPAVGEELIFRGLFQRLFTEWLRSPHVAIWLTAILFSAIHLQFYGFLPRLVLGLILGYLFYFSGSLWLPIFAHFLQNGSVVVLKWMEQLGVFLSDYENFGATGNIFLFIISVLLLVALFLLLYWWSRQKGHTDIKEQIYE
jgi:membrane protease YdiL (CAAX protease family)